MQLTKEHVIINEESDLKEITFNFTLPYNLQQLGFVERDGDSFLNWRINSENGGGCGSDGWRRRWAVASVVVWWIESGAVVWSGSMGEEKEIAFQMEEEEFC
jgi:hypothetical protein